MGAAVRAKQFQMYIDHLKYMATYHNVKTFIAGGHSAWMAQFITKYYRGESKYTNKDDIPNGKLLLMEIFIPEEGGRLKIKKIYDACSYDLCPEKAVDGQVRRMNELFVLLLLFFL